ncbi:MAG: hypothetical protein ACAF41_34425 (plasmid) [Leptolyngbya sp. BL-A-14]
MHRLIVQKIWLPLIVMSGIVGVGIRRPWAVRRSPTPESDDRQSLQLLFNKTNPVVRSVKYKPRHLSAHTRDRSFPRHLN